MVESLRGRLTLWYAGILALTVGVIAGSSYLLLARALRGRLDASLLAMLDLAGSMLQAEHAEGEEPRRAALSVVEESVPPQQAVAIVGPNGTVLAHRLLPGLSLPAAWPEPPGGPGAVALHVLTVSDTGTGIPPEHQPRVFERLYRVDDARGRTTGEAGAGLGLAISRWIVEAHGGRLELTRSDASGTVFTTTLPYTANAKAAGSTAA